MTTFLSEERQYLPNHYFYQLIGVSLISGMLAVSPAHATQLLALFVKGNSDTVLKYEGWLRPFFPLHNTQHTTKTPQYWKTFHKLKAYLQTLFESLKH